MGTFPLNLRQKVMGWAATAVMSAAAVALFAFWGRGESAMTRVIAALQSLFGAEDFWASIQ